MCKNKDHPYLFKYLMLVIFVKFYDDDPFWCHSRVEQFPKWIVLWYFKSKINALDIQIYIRFIVGHIMVYGKSNYNIF